MKRLRASSFVPLIAVAALPFFTVHADSIPESTPKLKIVTTTGMIADGARRVGGDAVEVVALMGAGVDPHLYKATHGDLERLSAADLILYNGLHLEGKISEVLEKLAKRKPCIAVTDEIDRALLRKPPEFAGQYDPHVWFDVDLWRQSVERIAKALAAHLPTRADELNERGRAYSDELKELHSWTKSEISQIPAERRVLITAHDAFGYFGRAYGIEVRGLQGISTATEFGLHDVTTTIDLVIERGVKAVFVESSVPQKFVLALIEGSEARGHKLAVGGELFSDAMGAEGTPEGSYIGMVRFNVNTIVKALR